MRVQLSAGGQEDLSCSAMEAMAMVPVAKEQRRARRDRKALEEWRRMGRVLCCSSSSTKIEARARWRWQPWWDKLCCMTTTSPFHRTCGGQQSSQGGKLIHATSGPN